MADRTSSGAGFLSSTDIKQELDKGNDSQIKIWDGDTLITRENPHITHIGYDLSLGNRRPFDLVSYKYLKVMREGDNEYVEIKAGHTVSVETRERVCLGDQVGALVESKVRMVSKGISHISTTVDPTWDGKLMLTFSNNSGKNIRIDIGTPIVTLVFFRSISPVVGRADVHAGHNDTVWRGYSEMAAKSGRFKARTTVLVFILFLVVIVWAGGRYVVEIQDFINGSLPEGKGSELLFAATLALLAWIGSGIWKLLGMLWRRSIPAIIGERNG